MNTTKNNNHATIITGRLFETPLVADDKNKRGFKTVMVKGREVSVLEVDVALIDEPKYSITNAVTGVTQWHTPKAKVVLWGEPAEALFADGYAGDEVSFVGYWKEEQYYSQCTNEIKTAKKFVVPEDRCIGFKKRGQTYRDAQEVGAAVAAALEEGREVEPDQYLGVELEREEARLWYGV